MGSETINHFLFSFGAGFISGSFGVILFLLLWNLFDRNC